VSKNIEPVQKFCLKQLFDYFSYVAPLVKSGIRGSNLQLCSWHSSTPLIVTIF